MIYNVHIMDINNYISNNIFYNEKIGVNAKSSSQDILSKYQLRYGKDLVELPLSVADNMNLHINFKILEPIIKEFIEVSYGVESKRSYSEKVISSSCHEIYNNLLIEGYTTSRKLIDNILNKNSHDKLDKSDYIIKNICNAMQFSIEGRPINKDNLLHLYKTLTLDLEMGNQKLDGPYYRLDKVFIGDAYEGASPQNIDKYMEQLFNFINSDECTSEYELIVKLIICHFYFEYIHPYYDYNGRTGRILIIWMANNNGLYKDFAFFSTSLVNYREQYLKLFKQTRYVQVVDVTYFVAKILSIMIKQKQHFATVLALNDYVSKTFNKKLNSIQRDILMWDQSHRDIYTLSDDADVSINHIVNQYTEYSQQYIYRQIDELEKFQILVKLSNRNTCYRVNYNLAMKKYKK